MFAHRDCPVLTPGGRRRLQGHDEIVWAVEVLGCRLFSVSADKTIRVWDTDSCRCTQARPAYRTSLHLF